jgi:hypothetical protein
MLFSKIVCVGLVLLVTACVRNESARDTPVAQLSPVVAAPPSAVTLATAVSSQPSATDQSKPNGANLRAYVDPRTGQLRQPTAAELVASKTNESVPTANLKQPSTPPKETKLPDGTTMYDMRDQPVAEEKVCIQPDGSFGSCAVPATTTQ